MCYIMIKKLLLLISLLFSFALHATTWLSSGQYDISWYNSSKSEFTISTAKQFAGIAYLVNEGYTTFRGKTIYLDSDISLSGNTWVSVGNADGNQCFQGKLNGQGHTISSLFIRLDNGNYPNYGLFAQLRNAEISNLICKGNVYLDYQEEMYKVETKAGLLVAYAKNTIFNNCRSVGDIYYERRRTQGSYPYEVYLGGIAGQTESCNATGCAHEGDFNLTLGTEGTGNANHNGGSVYMGGIAGNATGGTFKLCGTIADRFRASLSSSKQHNEVTTYMGGIAGHVDSRTKFDACYSNISEFETSLPRTTYGSGSGSAQFIVGGITSHTSFGWDTGYIYNCYSSCDILNASGQAVKYGGICGKADASDDKYKANFSPSSLSGTYDDQYVITSEGYDGSTSFSVSEMKSDSFLDELNLYPMLNGLDYIWYFLSQNSFPVVRDKPAKLSYKILSTTDKTVEVVANDDVCEGDIVIPETVKIDGTTYTVVRVGDYAFATLNLWDGDGYKEFHRGEKVTSIQLPNTLKEIGECAFYGCVNITAISVPETVYKIEHEAFGNCVNLSYLYFGKALNSIEYPIFDPLNGEGNVCCVLEEIKINPENPFFSVKEGVLFNKNLSVLICCPPGKSGAYTVPETVYEIKDDAFAGCVLLKSVVIPNNVKEIGSNAFFNCPLLTSITVPRSLIKLGASAFKYCNSLNSVYYAAENPKQFIEEEYSEFFSESTYENATLYVPENAVSKCKNIEPWKNFKSIKAYDFAGVDEILVDADTDANMPYEVYNLNGIKIADSTDNIAPGIYIVRQGSKIKKIVVN